MPHKNKNRRRRNRGGRHKMTQPGVDAPLQGIDQKRWRQNDVVPITIRPGLSIPAGVPCIVVCACDCNGYSWQIQRQDTAAVIGAGTRLYGDDSGQFLANAIIYEEYRIMNVTLDVKLNQGGSLYSFGPLVKVVDPVGILDQLNTSATATTLNQVLESMRNCSLVNPYKPSEQHLDLNRWILQTQTPAWRKTQVTGTTTPGRQEYVTNQAGGSSNFRTPGLAYAFTVTSSQAVSTAQLGIFETKTQLIFRQRRLDPSANPTLSETKRKRIQQLQSQILYEQSSSEQEVQHQYLPQDSLGAQTPRQRPPNTYPAIAQQQQMQQVPSSGLPCQTQHLGGRSGVDQMT